MKRVAIIGGGLSGLASAFELKARAPTCEIRVFESSHRVGGLLRTQHREGFRFELGPDAMITDKPWGLELVARLGIESKLVRTNANQRGAYVLSRGKLQRIPEGFQITAPVQTLPFLRSNVISWPGKLRALAERYVPPQQDLGDEATEAFVTRRFGRELFESLAQPLLSGIYGADPKKLSLKATMPRFIAMEKEHGSVIQALRSKQDKSATGVRYGLFVSFEGGMQTLVDTLANHVAECLHPNTPVTHLSQQDDHWHVTTPTETWICDKVILATSATVAAQLLKPTSPTLSGLLDEIPYGSMAAVTQAWPRTAVAHPLDAFGFVVPTREHQTVVACTWVSTKWPGTAPKDHVLLRSFVGGYAGEHELAHDDQTMAKRVTENLSQLLNITTPPLWSDVQRYTCAMPQYEIGHLARITQIDQEASQVSSLALAGNAYRGAGIPDAIHSGIRAAQHLTNLTPYNLG